MTDPTSIAGWLDTHAHRLRTLDPDDEDFSDLEPLRAIVGDARVVTIGESAHLIHEFLLLRDRLVRFLVSQLGFTGFALESGFTEGITVNDWVLGGNGDLEEVARAGITYGFGGCAETRALLRWMRSWNETHDRGVQYYGMDLPGGSGSMEPAVCYVLAYLDRVDPEYAQDFRGRIMPLIDAFRRDQQVESQMSFRELSQADRDRLLLLGSELTGRMSAGFAVYAPRTSPESAELALRAAINAWQSTLGLIHLADAQQPKTPGERLNPRDAAMRENIEWILQREERLIVAAHNAHLQRAPMIAGGTSTIMLGQHLAALEDLSPVVIGTTYASGETIKVDMPEDGDVSKVRVYVGDAGPPPANTIDALLDQATADLHLLDLRSVPDSGPVAQAFSGIDAMLVNNMALPLDPLKAFDALVHIRHVRFADADEGVWPQIERRREPRMQDFVRRVEESEGSS